MEYAKHSKDIVESLNSWLQRHSAEIASSRTTSAKVGALVGTCAPCCVCVPLVCENNKWFV